MLLIVEEGDYTVNTQQVRALFSATQPNNVVVTFRVDSIAQESNETFNLTLIPLVQPTARSPLHFYGEISNFKYFLKSSRTFNLSDIWDLPCWYLGLSMKKIQMPTYKFTSPID